jgi:hypothetical protein
MLDTPYDRDYKGLNAVPQAVPVSMCQRIADQTSSGTAIFACVAEEGTVLEVIVL